MVIFRSQEGSASKTFGKHWFRDCRTHCMRDSHVAKASIYIGQNNVKNAQKHPSSMRDSNKKPHCSVHPYDNQNMTQPQYSILMGYDAVSIGMKSLKFWNSLVPPPAENSRKLLRNVGNYLPISATSYSRRPTSSLKTGEHDNWEIHISALVTSSLRTALYTTVLKER
jgi:hypothetical protein